MNKTLFAVIALAIILAVIAIYFYTKSKIKEPSGELSSRKDGRVYLDGSSTPFTGKKDGVFYSQGFVTSDPAAGKPFDTTVRKFDLTKMGYQGQDYCKNGRVYNNGYPQNKTC